MASDLESHRLQRSVWFQDQSARMQTSNTHSCRSASKAASLTWQVSFVAYNAIFDICSLYIIDFQEIAEICLLLLVPCPGTRS